MNRSSVFNGISDTKGAMLLGVFPLIICAIVFIFLGSFGISSASKNVASANTAYNNAKDTANAQDALNTLNKAKVAADMNIFMLVCAGIMIIHAALLMRIRVAWPSAYASISSGLIVLGVLTKIYNVGSSGASNVLIYFGTVIVFMMTFITSVRIYKDYFNTTPTTGSTTAVTVPQTLNHNGNG